MTETFVLSILLMVNPLTATAHDYFVDQAKKVRAGQEWNREIVARKVGPMNCEITSPNFLGITIIADRAYRSLLSGEKGKLHKEDLVQASDHPDGEFKGDIFIPKPGSYWFMLENRSGESVKIRLKCRVAST